ncbi:MAG: hypothetical protein ACYSR9_13820, partial [Planctomycetota bacterium]
MSIENLTLAHSSLTCSTSVEDSLQIGLFMQNKANFFSAQMNATVCYTRTYENKSALRLRKNKPNSKPIKANLKNRNRKTEVRSQKTGVYPPQAGQKAEYSPSGYGGLGPDERRDESGLVPAKRGTLEILIHQRRRRAESSQELLIDPDSLLFEPLFQITHLAIENLVVVVLLQLVDVAVQFRLLLHNIAQLLFKLVAN